MIGFNATEILRFYDLAMQFGLKLPIHAHFGGLCGIFPQMASPFMLTPRRHLFALKHVVLAIKHVRQILGLTCGEDREKNKDSQKSHKNAISHVFGENPPPSRCASKFACRVISSRT